MGLNLKHSIHVVALLTFIILLEYLAISQQIDCEKYHWPDYGATVNWILLSSQLLVLLSLPQIVFNFLGLTIYNVFPGDVEVKQSLKQTDQPKDASITTISNHHHTDNTDLNSNDDNNNNNDSNHSNGISDGYLPYDKPIKIPHMCFRVITRGLYPALVQRNVNKNYSICTEAGLDDFSIEVVTDKELYLSNSSERVRQLVVPTSYRTSTGALFKARALQYALEPKVSPLVPGDYIIHLDEETLLTRNVINGIINFILDGRHAFGQGLITYASQEIVNWVTTLADSYRVSDDMGKLRFQLKAIHRPIFGWKGSFVVTKYEAELDVSFDHGPDGSIAEDCYFSMVAFKKGYTFDMIEGEMLEKSPFTILDLIRQRKRWIQGIWLVVHTSKIPIRYKFFLAMSHYAIVTLPITTVNYVVAMIFPLPTSIWIISIGTFSFSITLYMYIFGAIKSFDLRGGDKKMLFVYLIAQIFTLLFNIIIENVAVVWGLIDRKHKFYIVQKDSGRETVLEG